MKASKGLERMTPPKSHKTALMSEDVTESTLEAESLSHGGRIAPFGTGGGG